jgi:hypothetical protein
MILLREGDLHADGGPAAPQRLDGDGAAQQPDTLLDAQQAETASPGPLRAQGVVIEAEAVVFDDQPHEGRLALDDDADVPGPGVPDGVGQRLLEDAVQGRLHRRRQAVLGQAGGVEVNNDPVRLLVLFDVAGQGRGQAQVVQGAGAQRSDQQAGLVRDGGRELQQAAGLGLRLVQRGHPFQHVQAQQQGRQRLADPAVHLVGDAAAFVLLGLQDPLEAAGTHLFGVPALGEVLASPHVAQEPAGVRKERGGACVQPAHLAAVLVDDAERLRVVPTLPRAGRPFLKHPVAVFGVQRLDPVVGPQPVLGGEAPDFQPGGVRVGGTALRISQEDADRRAGT